MVCKSQSSQGAVLTSWVCPLATEPFLTLPSGSEQCIFEVRSTWGSLELNASVWDWTDSLTYLGHRSVHLLIKMGWWQSPPRCLLWAFISGNFSTSTQVQNVARPVGHDDCHLCTHSSDALGLVHGFWSCVVWDYFLWHFKEHAVFWEIKWLNGKSPQGNG